jgi:hypothetical protein
LIDFVFIICFQRMITLVFCVWWHVKIDIFPFHLALCDTHILLP